jgi:hypothetical protein
MSRAGAIIACAAGLLLGAVGGCTLDATSLNVFVASNDSEKVISGSLETVASSTEKKLVAMGAFVNKSQEGDTIRLTSCTPETQGKRFDLLLTRVKGANGEQTRVRVQWKDEADVTFFLHLVELVAAPPIEREARQPN